jgi:hypothetical protein
MFLAGYNFGLSYNNMWGVFSMGEYSKALSYYERPLQFDNNHFYRFIWLLILQQHRLLYTTWWYSKAMYCYKNHCISTTITSSNQLSWLVLLQHQVRWVCVCILHSVEYSKAFSYTKKHAIRQNQFLRIHRFGLNL